MKPQDLMKMKAAQATPAAPVISPQPTPKDAANDQPAAPATAPETGDRAEQEAGATAVSAPAEMTVGSGPGDDPGAAVLVEMSDDKMQLAIKEAHLEPASAEQLLAAFAPAMVEAKKLANMAKGLTVTSAEQKTEMKLARQIRLALKEVRVGADKTRKKLKEDSNRRGKAIEGVFAVLEMLVLPIEERLQAAEEFADREAEKVEAKLKADREELLKPYGIDTSFYTLDKMPEENFARLLDDTRRAHQAKVDEKIAVEKRRRERTDALLQWKGAWVIGAGLDVGTLSEAAFNEIEASARSKFRQTRIEELAAFGVTSPPPEIELIEFKQYAEMVTAAADAWNKAEGERKKQAAVDELSKERRLKLALVGVGEGAQIMVSPDLGRMSAENFALVLGDHTRLFDEEKERERQERRRLQAEKDAAEERANKAAAALAEKKKADAKKAAASSAAAAKAARAPDKTKIKAWIDLVEGLATPSCTTEEGRELAYHFIKLRTGFVAELRRLASQL